MITLTNDSLILWLKGRSAELVRTHDSLCQRRRVLDGELQQLENDVECIRQQIYKLVYN